MAGIGFELKKMFAKKGLLSILRAYGYAGIVCTGPMLLGIVLLLGIRLLAEAFGAGRQETEFLNSMITYTLLISLTVSNLFAMVTSRYTADQIYAEESRRILPSFWGSVSCMLTAGGGLYGIFLYFSGISAAYGLLCLMLFGELILVWTEINYLTAIKDYRGILLTFAGALVTGWGGALLLLAGGMEPVAALLLAVCLAYGGMSSVYYWLLLRYFPQGNCSASCFLIWMDRYPQLVLTGLFLSLGLFGHLVIMWTSPIAVQVRGWFYGAPMYDIPALLAFLSILITTINFVTSVEVNFYPKYRNYFSLFNDGGALRDIEQAEREMKSTLIQELTYTFMKQFFGTVVFLLAGTFLLPYLPLGMNADMLGIYRVLCIGYAFYAIGNCVMLIQLYFADNTGALVDSAVFMAVSCIGTWILKGAGMTYYGVGFLAGAIAFAGVSMLGLYRYQRGLLYHVLCSQPMIQEVHRGFLTGLAEKLQKRYERRATRESDRVYGKGETESE